MLTGKHLVKSARLENQFNGIYESSEKEETDFLSESDLQRTIMESLRNGLHGFKTPNSIDRTHEANYLFTLARMDYFTDKMSDEDYLVAKTNYQFSTNQL